MEAASLATVKIAFMFFHWKNMQNIKLLHILLLNSWHPAQWTKGPTLRVTYSYLKGRFGPVKGVYFERLNCQVKTAQPGYSGSYGNMLYSITAVVDTMSAAAHW